MLISHNITIFILIFLVNLTSQTVVVPYRLRLSNKRVHYEYNGHLYKKVKSLIATFLFKTGIKNLTDVCIYNAGFMFKKNYIYSKSSKCETIMHYLDRSRRPKKINVKYSHHQILYFCGRNVFLLFEFALEFSLRKHCFIYFEQPRGTKNIR